MDLNLTGLLKITTNQSKIIKTESLASVKWGASTSMYNTADCPSPDNEFWGEIIKFTWPRSSPKTWRPASPWDANMGLLGDGENESWPMTEALLRENGGLFIRRESKGHEKTMNGPSRVQGPSTVTTDQLFCMQRMPRQYGRSWKQTLWRREQLAAGHRACISAWRWLPVYIIPKPHPSLVYWSPSPWVPKAPPFQGPPLQWLSSLLVLSLALCCYF